MVGAGPFELGEVLVVPRYCAGRRGLSPPPAGRAQDTMARSRCPRCSHAGLAASDLGWRAEMSLEDVTSPELASDSAPSRTTFPQKKWAERSMFSFRLEARQGVAKRPAKGVETGARSQNPSAMSLGMSLALQFRVEIAKNVSDFAWNELAGT